MAATIQEATSAAPGVVVIPGEISRATYVMRAWPSSPASTTAIQPTYAVTRTSAGRISSPTTAVMAEAHSTSQKEFAVRLSRSATATPRASAETSQATSRRTTSPTLNRLRRTRAALMLSEPAMPGVCCTVVLPRVTPSG